MLSRIADSLYWFQRYMERADGLLRLLKTSYILSFDKVQASGITWQPALEIFTTLPPDEIEILKKNNAAALKYLLLDTQNQNSLKVILTRARENARGVQDQITKEVWEQINLIYHLINHPSTAEKLSGNDAILVLDSFINQSDQFCGITDSTMPRGQGWNYMNLGKYTERCLLTVEFTRNFFKKVNYNLDQEEDILFWRSLLLALSGYEHHLKHYSNQQHNYNVAKQVLFDKYFPRSLYYGLERSHKYLSDIALSNPVEGSAAISRAFGRTNSLVRYSDLTAVAETGLETFLNQVRHNLNEFTRQFGQLYFSYS